MYVQTFCMFSMQVNFNKNLREHKIQQIYVSLTFTVYLSYLPLASNAPVSLPCIAL
jgi:hypothetical protein